MLLENLLKSNNEKVESLIIEEKRIRSLISVGDKNENENDDKMHIDNGEIEISNSNVQQKITVSAENTVSSHSNNTEMDIQESNVDNQNISLTEINGNEAIIDIMNITETVSELPILKENIAVTHNNGNEAITVVEVINSVTDTNNEKSTASNKIEKGIIEAGEMERSKESSELIKKKIENEIITNKNILSSIVTKNIDNNSNKKDQNIIVLDKTNGTAANLTSTSSSSSSSSTMKIPLPAIGQETDIQNNEIDSISVKMEIVDNISVIITENEKIINKKHYLKIENFSENENENENEKKVLLPKTFDNEEESNNNSGDHESNENSFENEEINICDKMETPSNIKHNFITINNDNNVNNIGGNKTNIPQYSLHLPEITRITSLSKHSLAENNDNEKIFDDKTDMKMKIKMKMKMKNDVDVQNTSSTSLTTSSFVGYRTPR